MSNKDNSSSFPIHTLDLKFLGIEGAIACYLIPHEEGAVLVECGPGSTVPVLQAHLRSAGFAAREISDVLLTHIHLDHAGASGWLAQHGARIHVHPIGAPHRGPRPQRGARGSHARRAQGCGDEGRADAQPSPWSPAT